MYWEYFDGGFLILVYKVENELVVIYLYFYKKGFVDFELFEMYYL